MLEFINLKVFIISIIVGFIMCYYYTPLPKIVYKYPTPYNLDEVTYIDKSGTCYKYEMKEVTCPADKSLIKKFPIN